MTIYVDDISDYGAKGLWCHMWSDEGDTIELIGFAAIIGLKREWIHRSKGLIGDFPHFDLRPSKRELALKFGAEYIPLKEWIKPRLPERPTSESETP